jgi:hypothetical protein
MSEPRYIVFAFYTYYPSGGAADIYEVYRTREKALWGVRKAFKQGHDEVNVLEIRADDDPPTCEEVNWRAWDEPAR